MFRLLFSVLTVPGLQNFKTPLRPGSGIRIRHFTTVVLELWLGSINTPFYLNCIKISFLKKKILRRAPSPTAAVHRAHVSAANTRTLWERPEYPARALCVDAEQTLRKCSAHPAWMGARCARRHRPGLHARADLPLCACHAEGRYPCTHVAQGDARACRPPCARWTVFWADTCYRAFWPNGSGSNDEHSVHLQHRDFTVTPIADQIGPIDSVSETEYNDLKNRFSEPQCKMTVLPLNSSKPRFDPC
ncbi:hypothetical protein F511_23828 [Dorcoceras hygrometricum]|uniref:Uncharacterized protein n=1 Tax=Dorcoceras hygrometricum TaxID=472368 RepID=A0A2Z7C3K9_9LAMI|nr:hypothetical protein F511_23828 [Dorcoceras hygrometricum]